MLVFLEPDAHFQLLITLSKWVGVVCGERGRGGEQEREMSHQFDPYKACTIE